MKNSTPIGIRELHNAGIKVIHGASIKAYEDYPVPVSLSVPELSYMLERRGYDSTISIGAFDKDDLVGFIFNGIGAWNRKLTAYDTGTGLIKEYRRRGIATKLFDASLPLLRQRNVKQYLLEVLQTNKAAYDLYCKKGFRVTRKFDCFISPIADIRIDEGKLNDKFHIQTIEKPDWELLSSFWEFSPSWQNSIDSLKRKIKSLTILGAYENANFTGYGIIENHTGDIPQIGIRESCRRNGIATNLLKKLLEYSLSDEVRIINASSDYEPFRLFAESINIAQGLGQYEMLLEL